MNNTKPLRSHLIGRVNVGDMLTRSAARSPQHLAVVDGSRRFSYGQLNDWVNQVAHGLIDRGYQRGDALALMSGNCVEFLVTYYACAKVGVVCVPINLGWREDEVAYVLNHSQAQGIVLEAELLDRASAALEQADGVADKILIPRGDAEPQPDGDGGQWSAFGELAEGSDPSEPEVFVEDRDPLQLLYTSGTTSAPKGVVGSHLAVYLESFNIMVEWKFTDYERLACMMPLFHTGQLNLFCTPAVAVGATMVLLRGFDAETLLDLIESERITLVFGLPMMYRAMLDHPTIAERDLSSLRLAVYGMAPMPDEDLRRAIEVFDCDFSLMFGQTEMNSMTAIFRPEHQLSHAGAVGTPSVGCHVAIMGPDGELLEQGEMGEIVYRSPQVMNEYLHDEEATEAVFEHGWLHSGDVGRFDEDGILWFDDRYKDVIKTGGENVASIEVEKTLYAAEPRIQETVVVGLPHARWGEAITAVVVPYPNEDIDTDELINKVKSQLDGFKVPKSAIIADEFPRTSTGKVQKNVVRQRYSDYYDGRF